MNASVELANEWHFNFSQVLSVLTNTFQQKTTIRICFFQFSRTELSVFIDLFYNHEWRTARIFTRKQTRHRGKKKGSQTSPRVCIIHNVNHFETKVTALTEQREEQLLWCRELISPNNGWFSPQISPKMLSSFHEFEVCSKKATR